MPKTSLIYKQLVDNLTSLYFNEKVIFILQLFLR